METFDSDDSDYGIAETLSVTLIPTVLFGILPLVLVKCCNKKICTLSEKGEKVFVYFFGTMVVIGFCMIFDEDEPIRDVGIAMFMIGLIQAFAHCCLLYSAEEQPPTLEIGNEISPSRDREESSITQEEPPHPIWFVPENSLPPPPSATSNPSGPFAIPEPTAPQMSFNFQFSNFDIPEPYVRNNPNESHLPSYEEVLEMEKR